MDEPRAQQLTPDELRLWHAWKHASERLRARIGEDIARDAGLSDPDYAILTRLIDLGSGVLRQNELAASMAWHRSRLSHQLTRMEGRELVQRATVDGGVEVHVTSTGREAAEVARPVAAAAIRRHLVDRIPDRDLQRTVALFEELADAPDAPTRPGAGRLPSADGHQVVGPSSP
ncbi:MarR family winged helix-turn-helix transcriptional regulator [Pseudonocardia endophytica]|uniref:DNA-binding MarR family transcriptional regulator n=1 Tax=Pseudonocardia endophytica TaxID=401976 RepID=A0A4R1HYF1_PSEEN|nr:MarR family winged helix-turn-helix transcriptional regulator [Pseudonocardia endophytica]TCK25119.1 DNA-binding MarR family transcriptional regulator [Pseudonocardia endophytica]